MLLHHAVASKTGWINNSCAAACLRKPGDTDNQEPKGRQTINQLQHESSQQHLPAQVQQQQHKAQQQQQQRDQQQQLNTNPTTTTIEMSPQWAALKQCAEWLSTTDNKGGLGQRAACCTWHLRQQQQWEHRRIEHLIMNCKAIPDTGLNI
jgi:hypothetical protein